MQSYVRASERSSVRFRTADASTRRTAGNLIQVGPDVPVLNAVNVGVAPLHRFPDAALISGERRFYQRYGKRALDILIVLATLPLTLPIIALAALALSIEGGSPFYRQERLGLNGRSFWIFKLRTMCRHAEERLEAILRADAQLNAEWQATQKLKVDPRITPIGNFLRRTSIDELPQILNVLRGEMSLVGPRPMLPDQLKLYGDPRAYFSLLPGISGFWQVSDRNESHFVQRTDADWDYLSEISLAADLKVLWRTTSVVLRRTGY